MAAFCPRADMGFGINTAYALCKIDMCLKITSVSYMQNEPMRGGSNEYPQSMFLAGI